MDDYISRGEARKVFLKALSKNSDREQSAIDWHNCKVILGSIPAADVRPVVRGHYVGEYDGYADGNPVYDMWYCSVCGCCFEDWDEEPTYNFCPSCGADMRPRDDDKTGIRKEQGPDGPI